MNQTQQIAVGVSAGVVALFALLGGGGFYAATRRRGSRRSKTPTHASSYLGSIPSDEEKEVEEKARDSSSPRRLPTYMPSWYKSFDPDRRILVSLVKGTLGSASRAAALTPASTVDLIDDSKMEQRDVGPFTPPPAEIRRTYADALIGGRSYNLRPRRGKKKSKKKTKKPRRTTRVRRPPSRFGERKSSR